MGVRCNPIDICRIQLYIDIPNKRKYEKLNTAWVRSVDRKRFINLDNVFSVSVVTEGDSSYLIVTSTDGRDIVISDTSCTEEELDFLLDCIEEHIDYADGNQNDSLQLRAQLTRWREISDANA